MGKFVSLLSGANYFKESIVVCALEFPVKFQLFNKIQQRYKGI
jgi:hypothetical protein